MPGPIRIVTDSSAQFIDPTVVQRYGITVVPLSIQLENHVYREGIDISSEDFQRRLASVDSLPILLPPSVEQFAQTYAKLHRETDRIISLHISRAIHTTWQHARTGSEALLGRCEISVVDSQTTSMGLALLVEIAAQLAQETDSLDEVVRAVRRLVPRIYSIFSVEQIKYLRHGNMMSESQIILGDMLGIKPFLTIEEGEMIPMEKVKTKLQIADRFVEFVTEFAGVEQLVILQNVTQAAENLRMIQERLAAEFSDESYPTVVYQPSLACFLGPDATGIMIFERELDTVTQDEYTD